LIYPSCSQPGVELAISLTVHHVCFHGEFRGITGRRVGAKETAGID
jgi:hypothetical protein